MGRGESSTVPTEESIAGAAGVGGRVVSDPADGLMDVAAARRAGGCLAHDVMLAVATGGELGGGGIVQFAGELEGVRINESVVDQLQSAVFCFGNDRAAFNSRWVRGGAGGRDCEEDREERLGSEHLVLWGQSRILRRLPFRPALP